MDSNGVMSLFYTCAIGFTPISLCKVFLFHPQPCVFHSGCVPFLVNSALEKLLSWLHWSFPPQRAQ